LKPVFFFYGGLCRRVLVGRALFSGFVITVAAEPELRSDRALLVGLLTGRRNCGIPVRFTGEERA